MEYGRRSFAGHKLGGPGLAPGAPGGPGAVPDGPGAVPGGPGAGPNGQGGPGAGPDGQGGPGAGPTTNGKGGVDSDADQLGYPVPSGNPDTGMGGISTSSGAAIVSILGLLLVGSAVAAAEATRLRRQGRDLS